jgi:anaerobic nitric oxide reductase flavorubredoxin
MKAIEIADQTYWVGANVTTNDLFEGIWPIPDGVTLNSYIVKGEKVAMIDLIRDWGGATYYLEEGMKSCGVKPEDVDYLILNHIEPDHTGWLNVFVKLNPTVQIYATEKAIKLVKSFYKIEKNVNVVKTGDTLDLGNGKILNFVEIPNVHWPETMVTYESSTKVLFSCDAFGSFGALRGSIFDDEVPDAYQAYYEEETLRYYANIVGPFSNAVLKAIEKAATLDIKIIAPSHGLIWRGNPAKIINRYVRLAKYMSEPAEPEITVIWGTMYGNTEKMVREMLRGIAEVGVPVKVFKVPDTNVSYILSAAWQSAGLVIAMPTYEYKMFPPMRYVLDIFAQKHVWHKKVLRFGSFGWVGGAEREFQEKIKGLKWDMMDPFEFAGSPGISEMEKGYALGKQLAEEIKKIPKKLNESN